MNQDKKIEGSQKKGANENGISPVILQGTPSKDQPVIECQFKHSHLQ